MGVDYRIELIREDYNLRRVRVVFLRDYPQLPTPGGIINVRRGDEVDLPRWQAKLLERAGVAEIREEDIGVDYVNMYHYREKRRPSADQISPLPQDFYQRVSRLVERLDSMIRETPSHMLIRDREVVEKNVLELSEARLVKIIRLIQAGGEEYKGSMTPEEVLVFNSISGVIQAWRRYIKTLFRGGGVGGGI